MSIIFRFEDVWLEKNGKSILKNINFSVKRGEFFVILGENGSGKSSLLKLFNRLEINTRGNIFFNNEKLDEIPVKSLRDKVVMVMQGATLFEGNVRRILEIYIEKLGLKQTPEDILDIMSLSYENLEKNTEELSGGEGQLIAIGLAVARNPDVLLLDEVTSSLSITRGAEVREKMKHLQKNGKTIICITHNMENAVSVGERGIFLQNGRITRQGKIEELIQCFEKGDEQCNQR